MAKATGTLRVVGYTRCSTAEQADSGAGLTAQREAIEQAAATRGWELVTVLEDAGASGKSMKRRNSLHAALALVEAGGADALAVAKLDRLSRSMLDFAALVERAQRKGWAIVVLDMDFDLTTPQGELMANMLAAFAQFERRLIGQRTKAAMTVKMSEGVHVGRRSTLPPTIVDRIARERTTGASLRAICASLERDGIPTGQGGACWRPSAVQAVLKRHAGAAAAAAV
jgi:DNA invertase Pin-like site-specific DNA recombinase